MLYNYYINYQSYEIVRKSLETQISPKLSNDEHRSLVVLNFALASHQHLSYQIQSHNKKKTKKKQEM